MSCAKKCKLSSECAINYRMRYNSILIHFFSTSVVSLIVLCVRADDTALNSSCEKPSDLSQQELHFDLKNQNCWKIFLFSISYFLILMCQKKLLSRISLRKIVLKIWNSSQNISEILLEMYHEIELFQVYLLKSFSVLCIRKWCIHSEI